MSRMVPRTTAVLLLLFAIPSLTAQLVPGAGVPPLVRFSGTVSDAQGKPLSGVVGITFSLYKDAHEGAPLWIETQNVQLDPQGRYWVTLGSSKTTGLPADVFVSGEARWLGVRVEGQVEQPRVLLLSVPYALKAGDAETLGGRPASAFLPATPQAAPSKVAAIRSAAASAGSATITGTGSANFIPLWTSSTTLGLSDLFQTSGRVGLGTTSPGAKLDVLTGNPIAQRSTSSSTGGIGVYGISTVTSGTGAGVVGEVHSPGAVAAVFNNAAGGKVVSVQAAGVEKLSADAAGNLNLAGSINGGLRLVKVKDKFGNTGINVIAGNKLNSAPSSAFGATVGGGGGGTEKPNVASQSYATVAGGGSNTAGESGATVGGGLQNNAGGLFSVIAGGGGNAIDVLAEGSTIGGGQANSVTGSFATVSGGSSNLASGISSVVPGGEDNVAQGTGSFAAGNCARALHDGAFIWGDQTGCGALLEVSSTARNQFIARATGGATFITGVNTSTGQITSGVNVAPGSGSWSSLSDRASKDNFAPVDSLALLTTLASLPVMTWHYRAQTASVRHIGPTAQDFRAAFGLGEDERHISAVDADGVALAGVQALYRLLLEKEDQIRQLERRIERLERARQHSTVPASPAKR